MAQQTLSYEGAYFCNQLSNLGVEGFTDWLRQAYTGPEITTPPGILEDDDRDFYEIFSQMAPEFPEPVRILAATSVLTVLEELAVREQLPHPSALIDLTTMALYVDCKEAVPLINELESRVGVRRGGVNSHSRSLAQPVP